jgi:hypothetical protein
MAAADLKRSLDNNERLSADIVATLKRATARLPNGGVNEAIPPPRAPASSAAASGSFNAALERNEALVEDLLASLRATLRDRTRGSGDGASLPIAQPGAEPELEPEPEPQPSAEPGVQVPEPEPEPMSDTMYRVVNRGIIRAGFESDSQKSGNLEVGDTIRPLEVRVNEKGQQRMRFAFAVGPRASSPVSPNPRAPPFGGA